MLLPVKDHRVGSPLSHPVWSVWMDGDDLAMAAVVLWVALGADALTDSHRFLTSTVISGSVAQYPDMPYW